MSLFRRLRARGRYDVSRVVRAARDVRRHRAIRRTPSAPREQPRIFYGVDRLPARNEIASGGIIKFQLLAESLANAPRDFNVLYMGSSSRPPDAEALVRLARRRGAVFVWNQNGVAYRGWFGPRYADYNRVPARLHRSADHVVYQTAFCKQAAERFYGSPAESWEILPNPVDTRRFLPSDSSPDGPLTLLLGGNQYQEYRLETALRTLALLPSARLLVTGALSWSPDAPAVAQRLVADLALNDRVEFLGAYAQAEAPAVLRRAHLLLHTKVNDPCPTIVLEAMACGLPVVYSATGGTPELVGEEGGVGVPGGLDWERDEPPAPADLAAAVEVVASRLEELRRQARARAELFDSARYVVRHRTLFEELLRRQEPRRQPLPWETA